MVFIAHYCPILITTTQTCPLTVPFLHSTGSSPSQDVDDNSAAHHEGHQGAFGLAINSP